MKKQYITPEISFELVEAEEMMIGSYTAKVGDQDPTDPTLPTDKNTDDDDFIFAH